MCMYLNNWLLFHPSDSSDLSPVSMEVQMILKCVCIVIVSGGVSCTSDSGSVCCGMVWVIVLVYTDASDIVPEVLVSALLLGVLVAAELLRANIYLAHGPASA